jgi:YHS domain-containing protein
MATLPVSAERPDGSLSKKSKDFHHQSPIKLNNQMKMWILIGLGVVLAMIIAFVTIKKVSPVSWGWWGSYNTSSDVVLDGYDVVSYFNEGRASKGAEQFNSEWKGVTWHFASNENKALFDQNPDAFTPQFGGFCSFAMSKGFTADVSADAWHIENGKLYVFADQKVKRDWVAAINEGSLAASETNWAKR